MEVGEIKLLATRVAVGHCVILNDVEQPCGRLVAVITAAQPDAVWCNYLNASSKLSSFNEKLGMMAKPSEVTPIEKFGVEVIYDSAGNGYYCQRFAESKAKYQDGKPRRWQENAPLFYAARKKLVSLATPKE